MAFRCRLVHDRTIRQRSDREEPVPSSVGPSPRTIRTTTGRGAGRPLGPPPPGDDQARSLPDRNQSVAVPITTPGRDIPTLGGPTLSQPALEGDRDDPPVRSRAPRSRCCSRRPQRPGHVCRVRLPPDRERRCLVPLQPPGRSRCARLPDRMRRRGPRRGRSGDRPRGLDRRGPASPVQVQTLVQLPAAHS